jgi:DNA-directed RNA polymerase subunit E'/Rpb7
MEKRDLKDHPHYTKITYTTNVDLAAHQLGKKYKEAILNTLKSRYERKTHPTIGYIRGGSVEINSHGLIARVGSHLTGKATVSVNFSCMSIIPTKGMRLKVRVTDREHIGLRAEPIDGYPFIVIIPNDESIQNSGDSYAISRSAVVGNTLLVEVVDFTMLERKKYLLIGRVDSLETSFTRLMQIPEAALERPLEGMTYYWSTDVDVEVLREKVRPPQYGLDSLEVTYPFPDHISYFDLFKNATGRFRDLYICDNDDKSFSGAAVALTASYKKDGDTIYIMDSEESLSREEISDLRIESITDSGDFKTGSSEDLMIFTNIKSRLELLALINLSLNSKAGGTFVFHLSNYLKYYERTLLLLLSCYGDVKLFRSPFDPQRQFIIAKDMIISGEDRLKINRHFDSCYEESERESGKDVLQLETCEHITVPEGFLSSIYEEYDDLVERIKSYDGDVGGVGVVERRTIVGNFFREVDFPAKYYDF